MGQGEGKGKERKEDKMHRIQKFVRLSAICTIARSPSDNWEWLFRGCLKNTPWNEQNHLPRVIQSTLPSRSDLIPTWPCLRYCLSQAFTGAFFYGFSIQQTSLFPGWADPTTACLATDGSSSPTAAPTWRGEKAGIHQRNSQTLSLRTGCLAGEPLASPKCLKSLMNRDKSL